MKTKTVAKKAASLLMALLFVISCADIVYSIDSSDISQNDTTGSSATSQGDSQNDFAAQSKELYKPSLSDILEAEDRTIIKNPSGSHILSLCDVWQHTMDNPYGFSVHSYGGNCSINAAKSLEYSPYSVLEGESALYAVCKSYKEATSFEIDYATNHTIDLSLARYFTAGIFIAENDKSSELSYTVTLTITASSNSFAETKEIKSGDWYSLFFDISNVRNLSDVHYISLSIKRFGSSDADLVCAVDCLGASSSENALFASHYISDSFSSSENATISIEKDRLNITANGENPYIQTNDTVSVELNSGKALRIRFGGSDSSGRALSFKTATLFYTTITSPEFSESLSITADILSDGVINYCTFPVPESVITGFRIYLDGTYDSTITILSIDTCPGFSQTKTIGSVSECIISSDGQSISVKGSLQGSYAELYKDAKLYLYTLEPYESSADISLRSVAAAETDLVGSDFSFSLVASGNTNLFFKKYLVMIYHQGALIQVAKPVYITNPSILAESDEEIKKPDSIKGSSTEQGTFPVSGQKYTAIQVRLEKLVSQNPSQISHVYGGRSFYFDRSYVTELDNLCKECMINDQTAFFVLTVTDDLSSLSKFLVHPLYSDLPSGAKNEYCALNTETADGILYIRAICDFLAARYSSGGMYPCVRGFVLGSNIQNSAVNYSMGSVSLSDFAESVSDALHIIYNAVSLRAKGVSVYLSVGCDWNSDIFPDARYAFDSRSVIDAVSLAIKQSGDFDWRIAYDPYQEDSVIGFDTAIDENNALDRNDTLDVTASTFGAKKISFSNLELLVSYISQSSFRFEGGQREIILLEKIGKSQESSTSVDTQKMASADYILSYCKLAGTGFNGISAFIVSHDVSYIETYSLIDTNHFEEISKYALNLFAISSISELVYGFDIAKMPSRTVDSAEIKTDLPNDTKGKAPLFSFEDTSDGFSEGSFCSQITPGGAPSGKSGVLSVQFENTEADRYMSVINRIGYKLELSDISGIKFEVQPTSLPSSVSEVKLTAILSFGEDAIYASGYIKAGIWNTVYIDLSGFTELDDCDSIKLMLSSSSELGEPSLLVDTFYATSSSRSDQSLQAMIESMKKSKDSEARKNVSSETIKLLCLLILSAATLEVLNIMIRHRGSSDDNEK